MQGQSLKTDQLRQTASPQKRTQEGQREHSDLVNQFWQENEVSVKTTGPLVEQSKRHNEIRDPEAEMLQTVCTDRGVEPVVQVTGKMLRKQGAQQDLWRTAGHLWCKGMPT